MRQNTIILFLLLVWNIGLGAQEQNVVSTAGGFLDSGTGSISMTIGEVLISTHSATGNVLTQGFHQTFLHIVGINDITVLNEELKVYPNPVEDLITLYLEDFEGCSYILYNVNGLELYHNQILGIESEIDFGSLNPAMYLLKVYRENEEVQSIKIIKH